MKGGEERKPQANFYFHMLMLSVHKIQKFRKHLGLQLFGLNIF